MYIDIHIAADGSDSDSRIRRYLENKLALTKLDRTSETRSDTYTCPACRSYLYLAGSRKRDGTVGRFRCVTNTVKLIDTFEIYSQITFSFDLEL